MFGDVGHGLETWFPPREGRVHEAVGASAMTFAAIAAGARGGEALWLMEARDRTVLDPAGLSPFCDPGRMLMARAPNQRTLLALAEEALRSSAVKTVIAECTKPLDLTAGRRLQLAAEAGGALGLMLVAHGMGSNAAETRWRCVPLFHAADSTRMRWELIKNKKGTITGWTVCWDDKARRIAVVSEAGG